MMGSRTACSGDQDDHQCHRRSLTALFGHGVFVKEVLSHAALRGSHAAQVRYPVSELFDRFDLLIQIMCFYEVTHLWIKWIGCYSYYSQILQINGTACSLTPNVHSIWMHSGSVTAPTRSCVNWKRFRSGAAVFQQQHLQHDIVWNSFLHISPVLQAQVQICSSFSCVMCF